MRRRAALPAGAVAALLLVVASPTPMESVRVLLAASAAAEPAEPLVALVALLCWSLAGWLVLTALLTGTSRLPGRCGAAGTAVLRRVAPVAIRQAVALTLGVGVVVGAVGVNTAGAAPASPTASTGNPAPATPDAVRLDWPGLSSAPAPAPPQTAGSPSPGATTSASAASQAASTAAPRPVAPHSAMPTPATHGPATVPPGTAPAISPAAALPAQPRAGGIGDQVVVVRPGDTLWDLASAQLPPGASSSKIASAWPTWWAANRELVGDDPNLLIPGQHLQRPDAAGRPASGVPGTP